MPVFLYFSHDSGSRARAFRLFGIRFVPNDQTFPRTGHEQYAPDGTDRFSQLFSPLSLGPAEDSPTRTRSRRRLECVTHIRIIGPRFSARVVADANLHAGYARTTIPAVTLDTWSRGRAFERRAASGRPDAEARSAVHYNDRPNVCNRDDESANASRRSRPRLRMSTHLSHFFGCHVACPVTRVRHPPVVCNGAIYIRVAAAPQRIPRLSLTAYSTRDPRKTRGRPEDKRKYVLTLNIIKLRAANDLPRKSPRGKNGPRTRRRAIRH